MKESNKNLSILHKTKSPEFEEMFRAANGLPRRSAVGEQKIIDKYNIKRVVVTLGANGVIGVTENEAYRISARCNGSFYRRGRGCVHLRNVLRVRNGR